MAKKWYQMAAADQGKKNLKLAKKWYSLATQYGYHEAMYDIAFVYESEEKNYEEAKRLYQMYIDDNGLNSI